MAAPLPTTICLAKEVGKADKAGRFWTHTTVCGGKLINRLKQHGQMRFNVLG